MEATVRRHVITAAAALGGLLLFVVAVRAAGVTEIADGIRRVGWGLAPILGLAGLRFLLRTECWRLCMPSGARLPFAEAFTAFLGGDAVGNLTPLGLAASEPAKVLLARRGLATGESVSSLALDNLIYTASVFTLVGLGVVVALATEPLPRIWQGMLVLGLVVGVVAAFAAVRLLRGTWSPARGARPAWRDTLAGLRASVLRFAADHPSRLWRVYGVHLGFHALTVLEIYLALDWLLGSASPVLTQVIVFAALDRVVIVVFKFVPFRVGVDEAASGALASLLQVGSPVGVTLAVVRKIRNLFWTGAGLLLIAAHRARAARAMDPPGSASARPS